MLYTMEHSAVIKDFGFRRKEQNGLKFLQRLFKNIGYNSWIYKEGKYRKVYVLETLADFLDFNFNPLRLKVKEEKIGYIKGFFDAEGGIPKDEKADSIFN